MESLTTTQSKIMDFHLAAAYDWSRLTLREYVVKAPLITGSLSFVSRGKTFHQYFWRLVPDPFIFPWDLAQHEEVHRLPSW
jgi:hypothetical protein